MIYNKSVVVVVNMIKAFYSYASPRKWGTTTGRSSKGLFLFPNYENRLSVGQHNGRDRGYGLLWVSSEIVLGVAKLVPHERKTDGCCGSEKHY
jgi:hypothetical protein